MTDNTTLNAMAGGDVIATDDIGGVKHQRVKVGHGSDGAYADASAAAPLPVRLSDGTNQASVIAGDAGQNANAVAGAFKAVAFTTTTVQAVGATDVGNYRWVSVHITSQGTSSTVTFQGSNDGVNWVSVALLTSTSTAGPVVTSTTAVAGLHGPLGFRHFRLNVTGISAGTTAGVIVFHAVPAALQGSAVSVTNTPSVTVSGTPGVNVASGTSIASAKVNVTTAGTRVQLGTNAGILSVTVRAKTSNTGLIYVGGSTVTAANGFDLGPGEAVSLDVTNTNAVWIDAAVSGEGVSYLWVVA